MRDEPTDRPRDPAFTRSVGDVPAPRVCPIGCRCGDYETCPSYGHLDAGSAALAQMREEIEHEAKDRHTKSLATPPATGQCE